MKSNLELSILKINNPNYNPQQLGIQNNSTKSKNFSNRGVVPQQHKKSESLTTMPQTKVDIAKICQEFVYSVSKHGKCQDSQPEFAKVSNGQRNGYCSPVINFISPPILKGKLNSQVSSSIGICTSPVVTQKDKLKALRKFVLCNQKPISLTEKQLKINSNSGSIQNFMSFERKKVRTESTKNEKQMNNYPSVSAKKLEFINKNNTKQGDDLSNQIASSISAFLKQKLGTTQTNSAIPSVNEHEDLAHKSWPKRQFQSFKHIKFSDTTDFKLDPDSKGLKSNFDNEKNVSHFDDECQGSAQENSLKLLDKQNKIKRETFIGSIKNKKSGKVIIDDDLFTKESELSQEDFQLLKFVKNAKDTFAKESVTQQRKSRHKARYFSEESRLYLMKSFALSFTEELYKPKHVEEFSQEKRLTISSTNPFKDDTFVLNSEKIVRSSKQSGSFSFDFNRTTTPIELKNQSVIKNYSFLTIQRHTSDIDFKEEGALEQMLERLT